MRRTAWTGVMRPAREAFQRAGAREPATGPRVEPYGHVPVAMLWVCVASARPGPYGGRRSTRGATRWALAGHTYVRWWCARAVDGTEGCDVFFSLRCERVRRSAPWPLRKADGDACIG